MNRILDYFKNIQGSPKTTFTGFMLMVLSVVLYYTTETDITYMSVEALLFILGLGLFFKRDYDNGIGNE